MKKSGKLYAAAAASICALLTAGAALSHVTGEDAKAAQEGYHEMTLSHGDLELSFMGEGTTSEGSTLQEVGFDAEAVEFMIEESYAAAGDEVKCGDPLYKLSQDSIQEAASYYEKQVAKAIKTADRAKTAYEAGMAEAEYTRTKAESTAGSAKEKYDTANRQAEEKVTEAQTAIDEAQAQIDVLCANLAQDVYRTDFGVEEKKKSAEEAQKAETKAKKAYQEAKSAYEETALAFDTAIAQLQQKAAESPDTASFTELAAELTKASQDLSQKKEEFTKTENAWEIAQEAAKKALEEYHAADTSYEKAVSEALARKEELENSLAALQRAYTNAVNTAELEKARNQDTYDSTMLQGEYAQTEYESTVSALKAEYVTAEEALQQIKEEQDALELLENGVVPAAYDGTLSQVYYGAGDILKAGTALAGFSDTDVLTVAVEVTQEDIAKIAVGDTVCVTLPSIRAEDVEGKISTIASEATSGRSMSSVTYTVKVSIDNSSGVIPTGASAYVTFTYGELLDVDYILTEALYGIDETTASVRVYNEEDEVEERQVTIGESAGRYTVIIDGLDADTVCVTESGKNYQDQDKQERYFEEGRPEDAFSDDTGKGQEQEYTETRTEKFQDKYQETQAPGIETEKDSSAAGGKSNERMER